MKAILLTVSLFITFIAGAQSNFNGNYTINKGKVNFGAAPEGVLPKGIEVKQTKDSVVVTRTAITDAKNTESLGFKGETFKVTTSNGSSTSLLKWAEDKKTFTLDRASFNQAGEVSVKVFETWSLEDGGKLLVLKRDVEQNNGMKYTIIGYYDKN